MNPFRRASMRYGRTPEPETPYQKAAQVWDERIGCRACSGEELAADGLRIADPVGGIVLRAGLAIAERHGRAVGRAGR